MRLSTILQGSAISPLAAVGLDPEIRGVSLDSRRAEEGDLFFAIRGYRTDGERFVPDALRRGVRAVVAASPRPVDLSESVAWIQVDEPRRAAATMSREFYGRPDEAMTLVGVTGTNGKTTVVHLLESIARSANWRNGRIGTIGYAFEGREFFLERTTPEATDFYELLSDMREAEVEIVAMEVSSHALELHRVEGARFDVAAFLNISHDHLDFHGDAEAYLAAKLRLFESLDSDQWAVVPADSEIGAQVAARTKARVLTFGRSASADVRLTEEHSGLEGSSAVLETPSGRLPIRTFLLGRYNLDNVAAAAACAHALTIPPEALAGGVLALEGVRGRMELVDHGQPFPIVVDYAHTDAALGHLLSWVREVTDGRVMVVFGCGGSRDVEKRPVMGRVAAELADRIFLTSDNPRDEDPDAILDQIVSGIEEVPGAADRYARFVRREDAIAAAIGEAGERDLVVIAGKGHETRQQIGGTSRPFDDRLVAADALARQGFSGGRRAGA